MILSCIIFLIEIFLQNFRNDLEKKEIKEKTQKCFEIIFQPVSQGAGGGGLCTVRSLLNKFEHVWGGWSLYGEVSM